MKSVKQEDKVFDVCAELERERERRKRVSVGAWLKLRNLCKTNNNSNVVCDNAKK